MNNSESIMGAAEWRTTIENALMYADDYVWAYTEAYNWWGTATDTSPQVPSELVDATRQALDSSRE